MKKNGFKKEVSMLDEFIEDSSSRINIDIDKMLSGLLQRKYRRSK